MAGREKVDVALKAAPKGRGKKRATTADKRVATPKTEHAYAPFSLVRLIVVATRSEEDANKGRSDLPNLQARLVKVAQEEMLDREYLGKVREQSAGSAKAAEEALRQLTEMSTPAQALEVEVKISKSQTDGVAKTRDNMITSAHAKGREAKIHDFCIGLLKDELESLKQKELTECNTEVVRCKVAKAKDKVTNVVDGLPRDTFDSYDNIRHNIDQTLLVVGSRLS